MQCLERYFFEKTDLNFIGTVYLFRFWRGGESERILP